MSCGNDGMDFAREDVGHGKEKGGGEKDTLFTCLIKFGMILNEITGNAMGVGGKAARSIVRKRLCGA